MAPSSDHEMTTSDEEEEYDDHYEVDSDDQSVEEDDLSMGDADEYPDTSSDADSISISDSGFGTKTKGKSRETLEDNFGIEFKVLGLNELRDQQDEAVKYVEGLTGLKESEAATLLRFFTWKKDKLIETYMTSPEETLASAGITSSSSSASTSASSSRLGLQTVPGFTCQICYDDEKDLMTLSLSCGHRYCKSCYSRYVTKKVVDEGESRRIQCMGSDCNVVMDEATVGLLVGQDVLHRYQTLLNRTYVDDSRTLRWCPAPNCDNAISCPVPPRSLDRVIPTVLCTCGTSFCFGCGDQDHRPCVCPIVKRWRKKCADDSETSNWISANTKECTKCHSTIEKNGGCNHMTCKKCTWEFCWVCMGAWSEHGTAWYNCSRYEEKGDTGKDAQSKSRASLERYLHYYNRFANHETSIKLEAELMARTEAKMEALQESSGLSWIECQFLAKAVETLGKCRTVLKWTYAMAFYLEKNNQTQMFEDNQNDLEQAVEALSEMIEKPLEDDKFEEIRQQTTDKTVYVAQRCRILLQDTLSGYDEDRWIWQDPIKM